MSATWARLIKHATSDGLVEVFEDVPLGQLYRIDLDRARMVALIHTATATIHYKVMVPDVEHPDVSLDDPSKGGWFPLELLEVIAPANPDSEGGST